MHNDVARHYDLLIDADNDPVHDPETLQAYMNLWDGAGFIAKLQLDHTKAVLEIGVGTGRLAVRTAPLCKTFCGIDLSPKTILRARENLSSFGNVELRLGDFMNEDFGRMFDVVYSSLTFMHIQNKQEAIRKAVALLKPGGRFVLSIDKNQETVIDAGMSRISVFPDDPLKTAAYIREAGLRLAEQTETAFAHVFAAVKDRG